MNTQAIANTIEQEVKAVFSALNAPQARIDSLVNNVSVTEFISHDGTTHTPDTLVTLAVRLDNAPSTLVYLEIGHFTSARRNCAELFGSTVCDVANDELCAYESDLDVFVPLGQPTAEFLAQHLASRS